MAFARVTATGSVVLAIVLAVLVPDAPGTELAVLVGWLAVLVLAVGLVFGTRTALVFAAVAFVVRIAMVSVAIGGLIPPLWAQVAMLVIIFELAAVSMEARTRHIPAWRSMGHVLMSAGLATAVSVVMESAVYGSAPGGLLLRIVAIAAVVVLVSWVVTKWGRAIGA